MEITFKKWESSEPEATYTVQSIAVHGDTLNIQSGPVEWSDAKTALGKIDDLKLDGSYLASFQFQGHELRGWLKKFVIENPSYAVQLLAEAHGALLIAGQENSKKSKPRT